ncbi:MAG: hypothetical protein RLZ98_1874 [Pseudomonadota bacterium]|jgi:4,5-dihydroxyphthalate decarboxylase
MNEVELTFAMGDYDHMADIMNGEVRATGIKLIPLQMEIEEIFYRFTIHREWDVSEMSMGKYVSLVSQGDPIVALPVWVSRVFRHASFYVRKDGPVQSEKDLAGARIGLPEWAQTAAVYSRGLISDEFGVPLKDVKWVQAGINQPGRVEKVELKLPAGITIDRRPNDTLSDMLVSGEIDVAMCAREPNCFAQRHPNIRRLFPDYLERETDYYKRTGIFPIMHVVALKKSVLDRYPWVAMNLYKAFDEARARSIARARDTTAARYPMAWHFTHYERMEGIFGEDVWPYGVEPARKTLEAFVAWAYEQGLCHRPVTVDELFPSTLKGKFKV